MSVHLISWCASLSAWTVGIGKPSGRQLDSEILHWSAGLIEKTHRSLPGVLFVGDFEHHHIDALLQRDPALVGIKHQRARFSERVDVHAIEVDASLIVAGHRDG